MGKACEVEGISSSEYESCKKYVNKSHEKEITCRICLQKMKQSYG